MSCNFESSNCGWSSLNQLNYNGGLLQADDQWTIGHRDILTRDCSSLDGSGGYLFVELPAMISAEKRQALFLSPPISGEIGEPKCLHVCFIVRNTSALDCRLSIALLRYDNVLSSDAWNQSVDGIEAWRQADISFEADGPFQIVISAVKTSQGSCQVFLDQISLENDQCVSDAPCNANEFRCRDNRCISQTLVCDQILHCSDGSDESPAAGCSNTQTTVGQRCQNVSSTFLCQNGFQCIHTTSVCNGISDCSDFSDEFPFGNCSNVIPTEETTPTVSSIVLPSLSPVSPSSSSGCNLNQFRCTDGLCLDRRKLCDGSSDCSDGLDEWNCPVNSLTSSTRSPMVVSCSDAQLTCWSEGKCLLQSQLCNGHKDCSDGSDETQCRAVMSLSSGAIGGIVGGCIIFCSLIVICGVFLVRKFKKQRCKSSVESQASGDVSTVIAASDLNQSFERFSREADLQRSQMPAEWANMQVCNAGVAQKKVLHTRPTSWSYQGKRLRTTLPFMCGEKPRINLLADVPDPTETMNEFSRNKQIYRSLPPIPTTSANMPPLLEALLEHQRRRHRCPVNSLAGFLDLSLASEHIYEEPVFSTPADSPPLFDPSSHSMRHQSVAPPSFQTVTQNSPRRSFVFSNRTCDSLVSRAHQSISDSFDQNTCNVSFVTTVPMTHAPSSSQASSVSSQYRHLDHNTRLSMGENSAPIFRSNIPEVPDVPVSDHSGKPGGLWEQSAQEPFPSRSTLLLSPNLLEAQTQRVTDDFGPFQARESEWNTVEGFQRPTNSGLSGNRAVPSFVPSSALLNLDSLPNGTSV